ncbi:MAG: hypothetical protein ACRED4_06660 [Brevundimonas sp.]
MRLIFVPILIAVLSVGLVAGCATGTGAQSSAILPDGSRVISRSFTPTSEDGAVTLECVVLEGGGLSDCVVLSETPSGRGFGAVALASAPQGRLRPNAEQVGKKVQFTMHFRAGR